VVDVTRPIESVSTVLGLNFSDDAFGALYAASLAPLLTQEHRFGGAIYLTGCRAFDEVLPANFVVAQNFDGIGCTIRYARSADEQLGMLVEQRSRSTFVRLSGSTAESVAEMLARLRDLEEKVVKRERDRQQYRLWHLGGGGPESMTRKFSSVRWEDVASNYPSSTRPILRDLFDLNRPEGQGRLILWSGAPGTGKTRAIQALASAWTDWCDVHFITDSERFFDSPDYLMTVSLDDDVPSSEQDGAECEQRWRLVIAEDADEYLRVAGGRRSAGALSRLLNLCDGLLGQGSNLLILLTTNQDVGRLDPALTRPGRCLSFIEFDAFSPAEARAWLGCGSEEVARSMTLAEMFERRRGGAQIMTPASDFRTGVYL
jgi:hypothetical protein